VLITALAGGAFLALDRERPRVAGVLLALTFAIKPQLVLVLPLLAWQARKAIAPALVTAFALLLASLGYAGLANHIDYATCVLPALGGGYAYYANQSWNGLVQRLFFDGDLGLFALPPPSAAVRALTWTLGLASYAAGLAVAWRWRTRGVSGAAALGLAWLVATMVSPIAWQHHYAPALFVFALALRALERDPSLRIPSLTVPLATAFALMASYFEVRGLHGTVPRLAVSYLLFGAVVLLFALVRMVERGALTARPAAASSTPA
jgi:hypothetical protein